MTDNTPGSVTIKSPQYPWWRRKEMMDTLHLWEKTLDGKGMHGRYTWIIRGCWNQQVVLSIRCTRSEYEELSATFTLLALKG